MKKLTLFIAAIAAISFSVQAQEVKFGVLEVGDFSDGFEMYNGSYFDMAPTNFYLPHSAAQLLYTPDLLGDLDGKENVKITNLAFKFYCESYEEISRNMKVYLQETDAVEFATNDDGIKQFFEYGNLALEDNYNVDLLNFYGEDVKMDIPLSASAPFAFTPGKSLLVTIVFDASDNDNCTMGSDYAPFYTSGIRGKAMTYYDNWISFLDYADFPDATVSHGCGVNVELPVTQIEYTYTEGGGQGEVGQRGDVNLDGQVTIADVTTLIDYLLTDEWK